MKVLSYYEIEDLSLHNWLDLSDIHIVLLDLHSFESIEYHNFSACVNKILVIALSGHVSISSSDLRG